jgi:hypothetical protein
VALFTAVNFHTVKKLPTGNKNNKRSYVCRSNSTDTEKDKSNSQYKAIYNLMVCLYFPWFNPLISTDEESPAASRPHIVCLMHTTDHMVQSTIDFVLQKIEQ